MPFKDVLRVLRGPAYLVGCATGGFENGNMAAVAGLVPHGLHGACVTAFPVSGQYCQRINETIACIFCRQDARRVQHVAHLARLALAYIGVIDVMRGLAGAVRRKGVMIVSPFEAEYDGKHDRWGVAVARLQQEMRSLDRASREVVLAGACALSMCILSCGTPVFLLPDADPQFRRAVEMFVNLRL
jgi:hypothetical protein